MKRFKKVILGLTAVFAAVFSLASCNKHKEEKVTEVGRYYSINIYNKPADAADQSKKQGCHDERYDLVLFSNNTYEITYQYSWSIEVMTINYGRVVTSYGTYEETKKDDSSLEVKLNAPTRMKLVAFGRNQVTVNLDTDLWSTYTYKNEDDQVVNGVEYKYFERADIETWTTKEDFITAYGREYNCKCDLTTKILVATPIKDQIPYNVAVTK